MKYHLGIDVGSISINTVIVDENSNILKEYYDYCNGRPFETLEYRLKSILKENYSPEIIAFTGTGGKIAAQLLNAVYVNEIIAQSKASSSLNPQIMTIIEMGGEDSKLILMEQNGYADNPVISDFSMNSLCAAGTGSFLDQQAKRLGISIEYDFGRLALKSEKPPRIAGRCSVFAKSDMIHLQQIGTSVHDIIAGLCFAVARNFKSTVGRGKELSKPVAFHGGVAANAGMVRAFREIYKLDETEFSVPLYHASMGAIGALFHTLENSNIKTVNLNNKNITNLLLNKSAKHSSNAPLKFNGQKIEKSIYLINGQSKTDAFLGIDVGSLSTNLAIIDKENRVLARRYLPTAGKPLEAIKQGLREIRDEIAGKIYIKAVGTTGSGRYLTGDFVGADAVHNEITAQATAAIAYDPQVDTIFEIGGQDSKYISISNGVIVDFEMNKVCAAGTGSFLEEQANKLGVKIEEEFAECGLKSEKPSQLGERCTVFMESDLNTLQQQGTAKNDLIAGLAYSVVQNYLNRVVRDKRIGNKIFFQGGVTNNKAVVAAFESITGKQIIVPPHFDITGAIGAAILARENMQPGRETNFKGFEVADFNYKTSSFVCKHCANNCEIKVIKTDGSSTPLYYGGICERYEKADKKHREDVKIPDLFEEREQMLLADYDESISGSPVIGIPRGLMNYYQMFPFWNAFFRHMVCKIVLSDHTNRKITLNSLERMTAETCLPVEVMHGHVLNLMEKEVDYIFLPFIVNSWGDSSNPTNNCNCPWIQAHPYLIKAAFTEKTIRDKLLIPSLHFRYFDRVLRKELEDFFSTKLNIPPKVIQNAINHAIIAQQQFETKVKNRGKEILSQKNNYKNCTVLVGRPYNTSDPALNLRLVHKLINMNILPVPVDFLPIEKDEIFNEYPSMYWPNGQNIIATARFIADNDNLFPIYLSNFRCGPDSFLIHFFKKEIGHTPLLHLEVDEHSADAGMITRLEAFVDSLKSYNKKPEKQDYKNVNLLSGNDEKRTIYFPYARDTVHILAAATRHCGIPSEVLPMQDDEDIALGRKFTDGPECFPFICTTGSFLKKLNTPGTDPSKTSFFMPDHNGPCRFGEYNKLQRIICSSLKYDQIYRNIKSIFVTLIHKTRQI